MTSQPKSKRPLLLGVENPLIDMLVRVDDDFLRQHQLQKNQMHLVDQATQSTLLKSLTDHAIQHDPGGACANTLQTFALLGGDCAFVGCTGKDQLAEIFTRKLTENGVRCLTPAHPQLPTGSSTILITPDAARTMTTFLGASQYLSAEHIPEDVLSQADWVYLSTYLWDSPNTKAAARETIRLAHKHQVPLALNLADQSCIERHKEELLHTLQAGIQLVLGNLEEGKALTQQASVYQALKALGQHETIAVLTMGAHGALIRHKEQLVYIEAPTVKAIDTTGAGDCFAAGFLFGLMSKNSFFQSGQLGCALAAELVCKIGPRLTGNLQEKFRTEMSFA